LVDDVDDPGAAAPGAEQSEDETIVRVTVERLSVVVGRPAEVVEAAVRDELGQRRAKARIQTFVPIFAERAARRRLADDEGGGEPADGDEPG
jgi:hypothetical protein